MSEDWSGIWVFIEQDNGEVEESSLGVLSRAREIAEPRGEEVTAVILGENVKDKAGEIGEFGAHKVIVVEHPLLKVYSSDPYFKIVAKLVEERRPDTLLFSATRNGRDLAGRLAVKFKTGLMAHVITLDYSEEGELTGKVPGFGGNIVAVVKCVKGRPQLATVAPGVFEPRRFGGEVKVEVIKPEISEDEVRTKVVERKVGEFIDISKSEKVVVAGMGTGGDLKLVKELAEVIGGDLGVTRPIADLGLASRDLQVGTTGVVLKGKLAIVVGASGAPHFVSGIRDVKTVISINKDPEAPIFEYSDYCVIGDLFEILPHLIEKLKKR